MRLLDQRVERFLALLRTPGAHIDIVMAANLWLVVKAALTLYGDEFFAAMRHWVVEKLCGDAGLCHFCGGIIEDPTKGMCDECWNSAMKELEGEEEEESEEEHGEEEDVHPYPAG